MSSVFSTICPTVRSVCVTLLLAGLSVVLRADDHVADLQAESFATGQPSFGHWGTDRQNYSAWTTHSNRLIPVYTFGTRQADGAVNLRHYKGVNSAYRNAEKLKRIYGRVPERTLHPTATWMDQTNIADLQRAAAQAGRKYIFLIVFDGMDWDTTRAAAIHNTQTISYQKGKGNGTHLQNYTAGGTSQFGLMVTSPHNDGTTMNADQQTVENPGGKTFGGYDPAAGGSAPWDTPRDAGYLISKPAKGNVKHAYTDSASSATSMMAGIKTYNNAIGVDPAGNPVPSVAHALQAEGWAVGIVSSVPISHATPACAYAHNVTRKDYQDISRDMLGMRSISQPEQPMAGLDVVLGGGFGKRQDKDAAQGKNFEAGNVYLADSDLQAASVDNGGAYVTAVRTSATNGTQLLADAAKQAVAGKHRLLGFFGVGKYSGHLPYQTADGNFRPVKGVAAKPESYSEGDIVENPTLADMTRASIDVLNSRADRFWCLVEAGDVDWANHDNNIDNAIGAVNSGDAAVKVVTDWVENNSSWNDALVIVTADHGHLFQLVEPKKLIATAESASSDEAGKQQGR